MNKEMEKSKTHEQKKVYVPPSVTVTRVILEGYIAALSVVRSVDVTDWEYEQGDLPENNADIILPF